MTRATPRATNAAATAYAYRARWPVMVERADGTTIRLIRARIVTGVLQVRALGTGRWLSAVRVWQDR